MRYLSLILALIFVFPSYGGGVSRSRIVGRSSHDVSRIRQKVFEYQDSLQIIAVPVSDLGLQYYYHSEPLRGRNLSDEDKNEIVQEIVKGVLAGIDERFEITPEDGGNVGGGSDGNTGSVPPPQDEPPISDIDQQVLAMMKKYNCGLCHTEGQTEKEGMPILLTKDGKLNILADAKLEKLRRFEIHDSVHSGRMPKNGTTVSDSDVKVFYNWINSK